MPTTPRIIWSESLRSHADCLLNSDLCVIKNQDFVVRGLSDPIVGSEQPFRWGVWTSLNKVSFERVTNLWDDSKLLDEPPYFGWLSNSINLYSETLNLKVDVQSGKL
jgi:hypothetical protein